MLQTVSLILLPTLMMAAAASDVLTLRIPNWLNATIAFCFLPMAVWSGMPVMQILTHLGIGLAILLVGFALYAKGFFGGGDAKLFAAASLWLGHAPLFDFLTMTVFAGGALSLLVLVINKLKLIVAVDLRDHMSNWDLAKSKLPYGIAIAIGTVLTFPQSIWMPTVN